MIGKTTPVQQAIFRQMLAKAFDSGHLQLLVVNKDFENLLDDLEASKDEALDREGILTDRLNTASIEIRVIAGQLSGANARITILEIGLKTAKEFEEKAWMYDELCK